MESRAGRRGDRLDAGVLVVQTYALSFYRRWLAE
jgi:hypothetical protein